MRISDWSSDVCSSDLRPTSAAHLNPNFPMIWMPIIFMPGAPALFPATRQVGTSQPTKGVGLGNHPNYSLSAINQSRFIKEIGRASGRERVLQSRVELGGRWIIKKKKTKNTKQE